MSKRLTAGCLLTALLLGGCTVGSGAPAASSSSAMSSSSAQSVTVSSSTPSPPRKPSTSAKAGTSARRSPSARPGTSASTSTRVSPGRTAPNSTPDSLAELNTCSRNTLTLEALEGGSTAGTQVAGIVATNSGKQRCNVYGFPSTSLRLKGKPLGSAAKTKGSADVVTIEPNHSAVATVEVDSSCNAPLSDTIRFTMPGRTDAVDRPMQLRGCPMTVSAFEPEE